MIQIDAIHARVVQWFFSLPADVRYWGVNAAFAVGLLLLSYFSYYCFRRGLGHRRFKGRWYHADAYQTLIQELYSGVREGRLPDYETMRVLDRHIYGRSGSRIRSLTQKDVI